MMRPLAPHGCNDLACGEDTILLDEDTAVSDVRMPGPGQNARVNLCMHHRQVYQTASTKRKCGVLTCYRAAKGARHGVPLCFEHMDEHEAHSSRRSSSPHPNGLFTSLRRRFSRGNSRGRGRGGDSRGHQDQGPASRTEEKSEGKDEIKRLEASAEEKGGEVIMRTPRARTVDLGKIAIPSPPKSPGDERLEGRKVWVKINVMEGGVRSWIQFMGAVIGMSLGRVRGEHDLRSRVRRHAQGYVKGEEWSKLPAEADLGLDRRLKSEPPKKEEQRRPSRSRSRSHSLGRIMQELDEGADCEGDPQEVEGMADTYEVARNSGQTAQDALATIAVVYETDEDEVIRKLRHYVRSPGARRDGKHIATCLEILKQQHGDRRDDAEKTEAVRKQANRTSQPEQRPEPTEPAPRQPFAPPPGLGLRTAAGGPAIRSLEGDSGRNPLLGSEGLVNQLFGGPEAARSVGAEDC